MDVISFGTAAIAVSVSMDCSCRVWSVATKAQLKSASLPCPLLSVVVENGQQSVYCGGNNGAIYEISLIEAAPPSGHHCFLQRHDRGVTALSTTPLTERLISGDVVYKKDQKDRIV